MSVKVAANRLILPPSTKLLGFYQDIQKKIVDHAELGHSLIRLSEEARVFRQIDRLKELSLYLSNFPLKEFRIVGQYYFALSLHHSTSESTERAYKIMENVAEKAPLKYRAEAMLSLGRLSWPNSSEGMRYFLEAGRIDISPLSRIEALRGIAILKSSEGYNKSSLYDLENLYPFYRYAPAHIQLDYLNSLAVELCEANRVQEANNISRIVLASPYAFAYPEWRETGGGIAIKAYRLSRSTVSVALKPVPLNVCLMPDREITHTPQDKPASIRSLQEWKDKMVKEPNNGEEDRDVEQMNSNELLVEILQTTSDKAISEEELRKIVKSIRKVRATKKP